MSVHERNNVAFAHHIGHADTAGSLPRKAIGVIKNPRGMMPPSWVGWEEQLQPPQLLLESARCRGGLSLSQASMNMTRAF
jgi:hypothetical protein